MILVSLTVVHLSEISRFLFMSTSHSSPHLSNSHPQSFSFYDFILEFEDVSPPAPLLTKVIPKKGAHVGCTLLGTKFEADAASSYNVGHFGRVFNSMPTRCSSLGRRHPFRPLHFIQHVTVLSLLRA